MACPAQAQPSPLDAHCVGAAQEGHIVFANSHNSYSWLQGSGGLQGNPPLRGMRRIWDVPNPASLRTSSPPRWNRRTASAT